MQGTQTERPRNAVVDHSAELSVIGSIMLNPDMLATVWQVIGPDSFASPELGAIYQATLDCWEAGDPVDAVTVGERLEANGKLQAVGGFDVLKELITTVPHAGHADYYAGIVADKARRRQAIKYCETLTHTLADPSSESDELNAAGERLASLLKTAVPQAAVMTRLSDVWPQSLRWLWPNRVPLGKLTLLAGDPGLGKSFITLDMAARVTRGFDWPDDTPNDAEPGSVVLLSAEDDAADTLLPRLMNAGADVSRIHVLDGVAASRFDGPRCFNLESDIATLGRVIDRLNDVRLVVIDPVSAYCGKTDSHRNTDVRGLLAPLSTLAAEKGIAVVAVTHLNKGSGGKAVYRSMGSLAFTAAARAVWAVTKDPADPQRRLVLSVKNNVAAETTGMAYVIRDGVVCWDQTPVTIDVDEAFRQETGGSSDRDDTIDVKSWLTELLQYGPVPAREITEAAKENGFSIKSMRRALRQLGGRARKASYGGGWVWMLENQTPPQPATGG